MFISMLRALVLVAILSPAIGCKSKTADCAAVGNRVVSLIRAELEREPDDDERHRRESMLPALKEELESKCKAEKWNEAARSCMDSARSIAELEKCDPDMGKREDKKPPENKSESETGDGDEPPDLPEPDLPAPK